METTHANAVAGNRSQTQLINGRQTHFIVCKGLGLNKLELFCLICKHSVGHMSPCQLSMTNKELMSKNSWQMLSNLANVQVSTHLSCSAWFASTLLATCHPLMTNKEFMSESSWQMLSNLSTALVRDEVWHPWHEIGWSQVFATCSVLNAILSQHSSCGCMINTLTSCPKHQVTNSDWILCGLLPEEWTNRRTFTIVKAATARWHRVNQQTTNEVQHGPHLWNFSMEATHSGCAQTQQNWQLHHDWMMRMKKDLSDTPNSLLV